MTIYSDILTQFFELISAHESHVTFHFSNEFVKQAFHYNENILLTFSLKLKCARNTFT